MRRRLLMIVVMGLMAIPAQVQAQDGSRINYGDTVQGSLGGGSSEQSWVFAGREGDLILIDALALNADLDTYLALKDDRGSVIYTDDDSGESLNARIGPYRLNRTGDFEVSVTSYSGSGDYSLQLVLLPSVPAIREGKPLVGTVNSTHLADYFRLEMSEVPPDMLYRLAVTDDESYTDPVLSVYGPNGFITSTEYGSIGVIDPLVLAAGNTYVIVVSWNTLGNGGDYQLELSGSQVTLLENGVTQSGELDYEIYSQSHYFRGQAGTNARITVTIDAGNIAPAFEVNSIDYEYYLFSSDGGYMTATTTVISLPATSLYVITVRDGSYMGDNGSYTITVEWDE